MPQKLKFIVVTAWILFSRSYDAYCTHTLTPDLSKEANPLVTAAGVSSWTLLLIILSALTAYALFAYYSRTFRPMNLHPDEKGLSFSEFVAYQFLGYKDHWSATLYKLPSTFQRFHHYFGAVMIPCLSFAGIVSTAMWILIHYSPAYREIHTPAPIYIILLAGCALITYFWNRREFVNYQVEIRYFYSN